MSATIYVTPEAMVTLDAIRSLDHFDRCGLADNAQTDVSQKAGYFLKSDTKMRVAILPAAADIAVRLTPFDQVLYARHVSLPASLRGCLFEQAPHLPDAYGEIVKYWSGSTVNKKSSGSAYYQSSLNEYMIDLSVLENSDLDPETPSALGGMDDLLSEGVVLYLSCMRALTSALQPDQFLEIQIPVYLPMLGLEQESFRTTAEYPLDPSLRCETIFIKIDDIRRSPNPDAIYIDLLRWESLDYGFFY